MKINDILKRMERKYFCGTKTDNSTRKRRYVESGHKWEGDNITYALENFTLKLGERRTRMAINTAMRHWKKYVSLPIIEIKDPWLTESADIRKEFQISTVVYYVI
jgi:hypothetical protein